MSEHGPGNVCEPTCHAYGIGCPCNPPRQNATESGSVVTNAQAALIAASRIFAGTGHRHDTSEVTDCAEEFLAWLEREDQPESARERRTSEIRTERREAI